MVDEIEMTRRNTNTNANTNRNRRPHVQVNALEENEQQNPPQEPFDPLSILVPVTDAVLIGFAVIVAISCVVSLAMGILAFLRSRGIVEEEGTMTGLFCKYISNNPNICQNLKVRIISENN